MQAFPCGLKLKCWRTSTPSPPGCPAPSSRFQPRMKSSSESGCVLSLETAECPEPLCPWRALPAHGATSRVASEDITPPSSLIRAHASDQVPPGASVVPRTPGPCRLSPVPAGGWPFPTLSLQSLRRRLDPYPAASLECTCPFLPREHRPHATEDAFGTRSCPCNPTSTGSRISGLQSFVYLQAPTLARPPDCIHRSIFVLGGRAVYTTHRPGGYPFRDVASLRVRLGQLTRLDLHQLDCSLVGCSLPHPAPRQTASLRAVAYPAGPGSQAMATAIPTACLASSAIRCRDVETGPNLGVLAVFPSNGATCRCPLPSTGSRGLNSPASAVL